MSAQAIPMYQGEDFSQQLSYFSDVDQTIPLVFTHPVMDLRTALTPSGGGDLLATFDTTGTQAGLITITAPGVISLTMPYAQTALIPAGGYAVDIFADVGSSREAITKRGILSIKVGRRITQDTGP